MDERSPDSNFIAADRSQGQPDGPGSDVPDRLRCLWDGGRRGSTDERCLTVSLFYVKFAPGKIKLNHAHRKWSKIRISYMFANGALIIIKIIHYTLRH